MNLNYKFLVSAQSIAKGGFERNPAHKNSGKFVTLTEFLELAKTKAVPGILVNIQVSNIPNFPIILLFERIKKNYHH